MVSTSHKFTSSTPTHKARLCLTSCEEFDTPKAQAATILGGCRSLGSCLYEAGYWARVQAACKQLGCPCPLLFRLRRSYV